MCRSATRPRLCKSDAKLSLLLSKRIAHRHALALRFTWYSSVTHVTPCRRRAIGNERSLSLEWMSASKPRPNFIANTDTHEDSTVRERQVSRTRLDAGGVQVEDVVAVLPLLHLAPVTWRGRAHRRPHHRHHRLRLHRAVHAEVLAQLLHLLPVSRVYPCGESNQVLQRELERWVLRCVRKCWNIVGLGLTNLSPNLRVWTKGLAFAWVTATVNEYAKSNHLMEWVRANYEVNLP